STRNIINAIKFEAKRQLELIESGQTVDQETRLFDALTGETKTMRSKEDAMDYRYFPDPDLPKLVLDDDLIAKIKSNIPELPHQKKERYASEYGLNEDEISILISDNDISKYFEEIVRHHKAKLCVTWITVELLGRIKKLSITFENQPISTSAMVELLSLIKEGQISGKSAKDVLDDMIATGQSANQIVEEKGLKQVSNEDEIEKLIDAILAENQDSVEQYRAGKDRLFGFFVGQVMKKSKGQANPQLVSKLLKTKL
ncbi:hypothetical protein N9C35_01155, partial [Flavobacteriaceae bacterium]|nr:hypothetical protein [Flavobacteriaceae bacterium]